MATDIAALSRNDIVIAINDLIRLGKRGAAADLWRFSRGLAQARSNACAAAAGCPRERPGAE
jgi:hypothetical protein